jgi:hypothetical protein
MRTTERPDGRAFRRGQRPAPSAPPYAVASRSAGPFGVRWLAAAVITFDSGSKPPHSIVAFAQVRREARQSGLFASSTTEGRVTGRGKRRGSTRSAHTKASGHFP